MVKWNMVERRKMQFSLVNLLILINLLIIIDLISVEGNNFNMEGEGDYLKEEISDTINEGRISIKGNYMVEHFDCLEPEELETYSLTKVNDCDIQDTDIKKEETYILLWQKAFTETVEAYYCEVSYVHSRWYCATVMSYSRISPGHNVATISLKLTKEQCKEVIPKVNEETTLNYIGIWGNTVMKIKFKLGEEAHSLTYVGKEVDKTTQCNGQGWMNKFSFVTKLQRVKMTRVYEEDTINSPEGNTLPGKFTSGGSDTLFPSNRAYTWEVNENCATELLASTRVEMVKWNKRNKYFIVSDNENTIGLGEKIKQKPQFRIEVKNEVEALCQKSKDDGETSILELIPNKFRSGKSMLAKKTNFDNLFVTILMGGFNTETGEPSLGFNRLKKAYCTSKDRTLCEKIELSELNDYASSINLEDANQRTLLNPVRELAELGAILPIIKNYDIINGTISEDTYKDLLINNMIKMDFLFYKLAIIGKKRDVEIIKMMCELERQQMLIVLQMSQIDSKVAGKLLTGKDEYFFDIKNNQGWLYKCRKIRSPWIKQDKCYTQIPVLYNGVVQFIDPSSRKIADIALVNEIDCLDEASKMRIQLDPNDADSWYSIMPVLVQKKALQEFSPKIAILNDKFDSMTHESINSGIYNVEDIKELYHKIQMGERQKGLLQEMISNINFTVEGMINYNGKEYWSDHMKRKIYMDQFISTNYFDLNFKEHAGEILSSIHVGVINFGGYVGTVAFIYVIAITWKSMALYFTCRSVQQTNIHDNGLSMCFNACMGGHNSHQIVRQFDSHKEEVELLKQQVSSIANYVNEQVNGVNSINDHRNNFNDLGKGGNMDLNFSTNEFNNRIIYPKLDSYKQKEEMDLIRLIQIKNEEIKNLQLKNRSSGLKRNDSMTKLLENSNYSQIDIDDIVASAPMEPLQEPPIIKKKPEFLNIGLIKRVKESEECKKDLMKVVINDKPLGKNRKLEERSSYMEREELIDLQPTFENRRIDLENCLKRNKSRMEAKRDKLYEENEYTKITQITRV